MPTAGSVAQGTDEERDGYVPRGQDGGGERAAAAQPEGWQRVGRAERESDADDGDDSDPVRRRNGEGDGGGRDRDTGDAGGASRHPTRAGGRRRRARLTRSIASSPRSFRHTRAVNQAATMTSTDREQRREGAAGAGRGAAARRRRGTATPAAAGRARAARRRITFRSRTATCRWRRRINEPTASSPTTLRAMLTATNAPTKERRNRFMLRSPSAAAKSVRSASATAAATTSSGPSFRKTRSATHRPSSRSSANPRRRACSSHRDDARHASDGGRQPERSLDLVGDVAAEVRCQRWQQGCSRHDHRHGIAGPVRVEPREGVPVGESEQRGRTQERADGVQAVELLVGDEPVVHRAVSLVGPAGTGRPRRDDPDQALPLEGGDDGRLAVGGRTDDEQRGSHGSRVRHRAGLEHPGRPPTPGGGSPGRAPNVTRSSGNATSPGGAGPWLRRSCSSTT